MLEQLKRHLTPPTFADEEQTRIAGILNVILVTLFFAGLFLVVVLIALGSFLSSIAITVAVLIILVCYGLMRKGHLRSAGFIVMLMLIFLVGFILVAGFGVHDPAILLLPIIIIVAGLIFETRLFVAFVGLSVLSVGLVVVLEVKGYVEAAVFTRDSKSLEFFVYSIILIITAVTVRLLSQSLKENLTRARNSEAQWRSLVKNAPNLILYLQRDGTIDFINVLMDQPDINVIGRTVYDFTHPDYHEQVRRAITKVLETGEPASYESAGFRHSGDLDWFDNRIGPVKQQETIVGLTMISTNITERREMEKALESERDFAQRIIDNMGQGLIIIDENGRFEYVNSAYTLMTGYALPDLLGKTLYDVAPSEVHPQIQQQVLARHAGETSSYTSHLEHVDGHMVHVFITGVPRWQDNEYIGSIAVVTDLTEQIEAEMERDLLIDELEAQNAELERFTYTVSHDLKSPLITIRGFLGVLMQELEAGNEANVQTAVYHIDRAAQNMEVLLRDLLQLSRIGRIVNPPEEISFAAIVDEALLRVSGQIEAHNVQIEVMADLPVVLVDRARLIEVMQNLLDNAIKFSRDQSSPFIKVGIVGQKRNPIFFVQDNGVGIKPVYQDKIFGLFERLDSSVEGTGIGLALVKRIIEVHNGRLWVESAGVGQGATFFFTLPIVDSETETEQA